LALVGRRGQASFVRSQIPAAGLSYVLRQNQILCAASMQLSAWVAADVEWIAGSLATYVESYLSEKLPK